MKNKKIGQVVLFPINCLKAFCTYSLSSAYATPNHLSCVSSTFTLIRSSLGKSKDVLKYICLSFISFFTVILFLLHILFWLADFLLPICRHFFIIYQKIFDKYFLHSCFPISSILIIIFKYIIYNLWNSVATFSMLKNHFLNILQVLHCLHFIVINITIKFL